MHTLTEYLDIARLLWPSLAVAAAVAMSGAVAGVFIILRRDALVAVSMPPTVAVGAAVGLRMGWPLIPPAVAAVVGAIALIAWSNLRSAGHWLLPSLYVGALCLTFLVVSGSGAHLSEMQGLLTGIDVAVTPEDAALAVPVLLTAAAGCAVLWRRWLLLAQAPVVAEVAGLKVMLWEIAFLALVATILVIGTNASGMVMVLAMLFLPPATVLPWCRRLPTAMAMAGVVGVLLVVGGLVLSIEMDWPLSQATGGLSFTVLMVTCPFARFSGRRVH